jgi:hypothetical protein
MKVAQVNLLKAVEKQRGLEMWGNKNSSSENKKKIIEAKE